MLNTKANARTNVIALLTSWERSACKRGMQFVVSLGNDPFLDPKCLHMKTLLKSSPLSTKTHLRVGLFSKACPTRVNHLYTYSGACHFP